jgi:hypothetical protein
LGLALGLTLLTKTTAYVALPVALLAICLRARREGHTLRRAAARVGWVLLATALLAVPWLARNVVVYGWPDPLGLARHNAVVVGQPRTAEWLATSDGRVQLLRAMVQTTFQSFWGQFGWMGVPLHAPIYLALLLLTVLLVVGFLAWLLDRRRPRLAPHQRDSMLLLATLAFLTLTVYLWYNLTFVQHQGRYLFPALIPLALGAALGLEWLLAPRHARWTAVGLAGVGGLLVAWGLARGDLPLIPVGAACGLTTLFGVATLWPRWERWLALTVLAAGLVALDLYALFGALVPTLTR